MKKSICIILILSFLVLAACSVNSTRPSTELTSLASADTQQEETSSKAEIRPKAEKLLDTMTLEEKIGQLFIIRPEALQPHLTSKQINSTTMNGAVEFDAEMQETLKKYPLGGVVLFGKNISTPAQLTSFISAMQQKSTIPLFVSVDEEGGDVSRIAKSPNFDVSKFESMQKIGETGNVKNAKNVGLTIGSYLSRYGFNLNFAPVADINTNPENIVIGNRSFGSNSGLVAKMVSAEISGLHQSGVMSCIKHFPGHGDTKGDTHTGFVSIEKTWAQLKKCELIPFIKSLDTTAMIMVAHIAAPNITGDKLPASLSAVMVEGKLRKELGYKGVVITDSMAMGAITQKYSSSESAVKAILAGVDIILMPEDFMEAYKGVYNAVKSGEISEARIDESVLRILNLKAMYHLL